MSYATADGTTWPVNVGELEWQLRYAPAEAPLRQPRSWPHTRISPTRTSAVAEGRPEQ